MIGSPRHLWVTVTLIVIGIMLGALGSFSVPLGHGISAFWPAMIVQVAGGIWFGAWGGLLAAALFPIFTNLLIAAGVAGILGFIPANIAQGMIPTWAFRHFRVDPGIPGWRGIGFYAVWGALLPSLAGGLLGAASLVFFGEIGLDQFLSRAIAWALPNIVVSLVLGVPTLRILTPLWQDYGLLITGYWRSAVPATVVSTRRSWRFADQPLKLKMLLALGAVGVIPSIVLAVLEVVANWGRSPSGFRLSSLLFSLNLLLSLLATGWLSRWITQPIHSLEQNVTALIAGEEASLALGQQDEIGRLATAFDRLYQDSQEAIRSREVFIQVASHELRTPLTPLTLRLQFLLRKVQASPQSPVADITTDLLAAEKQVRRMRSLVEQVMDVSLLSGGGVGLGRSEFDLREAARDVVAALAESAPGSQIVVTADTPAVGWWDRQRIEQVITNLLANAIKFGQGKPVALTIATAGEQVILSVRDQGIGIAATDHRRIFEKFERAVSAENYGGLGLGLFIAKWIVVASGGTLTVESAPGQGAAFTIVLPYGAAPDGG